MPMTLEEARARLAEAYRKSPEVHAPSLSDRDLRGELVPLSTGP